MHICLIILTLKDQNQWILIKYYNYYIISNMNHNTFLQFSLLLDILYLNNFSLHSGTDKLYVSVCSCETMSHWLFQQVYSPSWFEYFLYIFQSVVDSRNTYRALTGPFILSFEGDFEVIHMIIPIFEFENIHTPMPTQIVMSLML